MREEIPRRRLFGGAWFAILLLEEIGQRSFWREQGKKGVRGNAMESTLAKMISAAGEYAAYDAACKRLLAHKSILAWVMKSCLEEFRDCEVEEIAGRYIEGLPQIGQEAVHADENAGEMRIRGGPKEDSTMWEGTVTYDIYFQALVPGTEEEVRLILNVEAQNDFYPGYPILKRALYYCSRMISSQYGTEFAEGQYSKIKKVYSIWICENPPKKRRNTINRYSICEENLVGNGKEETEHYDLLSAVLICLGARESEGEAGVLKLLEVLLSSERTAEEKKKILEEEFAIKMSREWESEVELMCNLSKGVEERGIQKGMQKGMQSGMLLAVQNLIESTGITKEEAMRLLKIPEAERERYAEKLKE